MKVELIPKERLDRKIKIYENYEKIPHKTGFINIEGIDFKIMDSNQGSIGFNEYKEQFDLFYKNLENKTRGKKYKKGNKIEINEDIDTVKRATVKEIREIGCAFNCNLVIRDTIDCCKKELDEYFNFSEPKDYSPKVVGKRLAIEITCSDRRYKPVKVGDLLTT